MKLSPRTTTLTLGLLTAGLLTGCASTTTSTQTTASPAVRSTVTLDDARIVTTESSFKLVNSAGKTISSASKKSGSTKVLGKITQGVSTLEEARAASKARNGRVAFASLRDGNSEIYTMHPDGSGLRRLTTNPGVDTHPSYSDDGSKIAYTSERDGRFDIWIMNSDGSAQTQVTKNPGKHNVPSFFPGGQRIAFQSARGVGSAQIYAINIDGTNEVRLSSSKEKDMGPKVSPDGTQIAFASNRAGGGFDLYVMNSDGTRSRRLTKQVHNDFSRSWSPDGRRIVYNNTVDGVGQIFVLRLKTGGTRQLGSNPGTTPPFNPGEKYPGFSFGTFQGDITPSFSPDGKRIVFASDRAGPYEIFEMDANGLNLKQVTFDGSAQMSTAWQPVADVPAR